MAQPIGNGLYRLVVETPYGWRVIYGESALECELIACEWRLGLGG